MNKPQLKHAAVGPKGKELPLLAFFGIAALCVLIDQLTKYWAVMRLMPNGDLPLWEGVLHLTYSENTGMAFSLFSEHTWILTVATGILICAMLTFFFLTRGKSTSFQQAMLAMIIGGGIGNLIDRIAYGYVVDFIYVKIINFAIFNAADSFVVVGCILLMLSLLLQKDEPTRDNDAVSD